MRLRRPWRTALRPLAGSCLHKYQNTVILISVPRIARGETIDDRVASLVAPFGGRPGVLLKALSAIQRHFGRVPARAYEPLAKALGLPPAQVYSVASAYHALNPACRARYRLHVCKGPACRMAGADNLIAALPNLLGVPEGQASGDRRFAWKACSCLGLCDSAPALMLNHAPHQVRNPAELKHLLGNPRLATGKPRKLGGHVGSLGEPRLVARALDAHLSSRSRLRHWAQFRQTAEQTSPAELLDAVDASGLRGRGGAGFPTGRKLRALAAQTATPKYVVANADEAEPGTFKDRVLLEEDSMCVVAGLALAMRATDATQGFIYLRHAYLRYAAGLEAAIAQAKEQGWLRGAEIEVVTGLGNYICGEETALLESIEGHRPEPRERPPFPHEYGLFGKPTVVLNVETLANLVSIAAHGPAWFREKGTADNRGTKLFSVAGDVMMPGVCEAPLGTTLGEIVDQFAGGPTEETLCILLGGVAGTVVPPSTWDQPLDHPGLIGNGAVTVVSIRHDPTELARWTAEFFLDEMCGACAPGREGVLELARIMGTNHSALQGPVDGARVQELATMMRLAARCALCPSAANVPLGLLQLFPQAFDGRAAPSG